MLQEKLKVLQRGGREGREGLKVLECSRMEENHHQDCHGDMIFDRSTV